MKWLALVPAVLALAAPPIGVAPAARSFEVWHGSKPSAWTLLTAPPKPETALSAPPATSSDEVAGGKPVLWTLRRAHPGIAPSAAPAEPFASYCPGSKPVAESLSANSC